MIKYLNIENFRSIQKSNVKFSPLTVIVGANSTGKSNLIKALDFISSIAEIGLHESIHSWGSINELLPKQYTNIFDKVISFKIGLELQKPNNWKPEFGNLEVDYEIKFEKNKRTDIKIISEKLVLKNVLLLAYIFEKELDFEKEKNKERKISISNERINELKNKELIIYRGRTHILYKTNFPFNKSNLSFFMSWLGFRGFIAENLDTKYLSKNVDKIIKSTLNSVKPGYNNKDVSIISNNRAIFNFSPHLRKLMAELQSIKRYDLLINELRQEQAISNSDIVSITGDNLPTMVSKFIKENKDAWQRITTTMSNISPYFSKAYTESLRAGKEYILFNEIFKGRAVESWEASDGTLRALAILLALESHSPNSTIMIEEPEHGLHPWAVKDLMEHVKSVIDLNNQQVIITTHSQQVLECIEKNELLITDRDENGTSYFTIKDILPDANITIGEIGEMWTSGLLKGVPTSI